MRKELIVILAALLLPLTFNQCAKAQFRSVDALSLNEPYDATKYETTQRTHSFSTTRRVAGQSAVDIVWIIDNSGSMSLEAAHVRSNFQNFASQVSSSVDTKLALISRVGDSGTAVRLPKNIAIPTLEINHTVSSTNGVQLLTSALCAGSSPDCDPLSASSSPILGGLTPFLRQNSRKVFVFVTDDDSKFSNSSFLNVYKSFYPGQDLRVFGIIGMGAEASPCQARTGTQYQELASQTGGLNYNICNSDWQPLFQSLTGTVIGIGQGAIALPEEVLFGHILSVELNGRILANHEFSQTSAGLMIHESALAGLTQLDINVSYQRRLK